MAVLAWGYTFVPKIAAWARPDDYKSARRKRAERERLGISEWEQDQADRDVRDGIIAAVVIVLFELAIQFYVRYAK